MSCELVWRAWRTYVHMLCIPLQPLCIVMCSRFNLQVLAQLFKIHMKDQEKKDRNPYIHDQELAREGSMRSPNACGVHLVRCAKVHTLYCDYSLKYEARMIG